MIEKGKKIPLGYSDDNTYSAMLAEEFSLWKGFHSCVN